MIKFEFATAELEEKFHIWKSFLSEKFVNGADLTVRFDSEIPIILDDSGRKFKIDFSDTLNYNKTKASMTKEPLARALGSGSKGIKLLDLSAGLGVDAIFLAQLGYQVTALERNALIYMALKIASEKNPQVDFVFSDAQKFLETVAPGQFDVGYFDPMFPDKKKSALPKQEMVFFKNLVGADEDAVEIVNYVTDKKIFKRFVVKRPLAAPPFKKPSGAISGKIIRYDIYGN